MSKTLLNSNTYNEIDKLITKLELIYDKNDILGLDKGLEAIKKLKYNQIYEQNFRMGLLILAEEILVELYDLNDLKDVTIEMNNAIQSLHTINGVIRSKRHNQPLDEVKERIKKSEENEQTH